jgi:plastocyanin
MRPGFLAVGLLATAVTTGACGGGSGTKNIFPIAGTTGSAGDTGSAGTTGSAGNTVCVVPTQVASNGPTFTAVPPCNAEADYFGPKATAIGINPYLMAYTPNCLKVATGATVTFPASATYPLSGTTVGSPGNPIPMHEMSSVTVTFPAAGFYSFESDAQFSSGMQGVIWVGGSAAGASGTDDGGGSGGSAGATDAGAAGAAGQSTAGANGTDGGGDNLITKVVPTPGCGLDPGQAVGMAVRGTIQTKGTKVPDCADSKCGAWSYLREYFVTLPLGYDNTKAYPVVFEGPSNGGTGQSVYTLSSGRLPANNNVDNTVIRVGLTPPPTDIGHGISPCQGCFDDHEGDDSVDWVFYESLYDQLAGKLCFDKNRVFASGTGHYCGGSWLANELGCKYAGDPTRPVRGVLTNNGGLPTDPRFVPTCTTKPMAGIWVFDSGIGLGDVSYYKVAIARAMQVNGCTLGTGFDDASLEDFPIGAPATAALPDSTCQRIKGCPDLTPLVVCALPSNQISGNDNLVNPGFSTFIKLFENPPLLTQ